MMRDNYDFSQGIKNPYFDRSLILKLLSLFTQT